MRGEWRLGQVVQVFPDKFGVVRNVELKVAQKFDGKAKYKFKEPSLMKRHVGRLIVLCAADEVKAKMRLQSLKDHSLEQRGTCEKCNKQFTRSSYLRLHNKTKHEGLRYPCSECDLQCTQPQNLKAHKKSVHERVEVNCGQCEFKSTFKQSVVKHEKSVREGVRYYCDQCDYQASQSSNLKQHQEVKHGSGLKFSCDQCDYMAPREDIIKKHKQAKHEERSVEPAGGECKDDHAAPDSE